MHKVLRPRQGLAELKLDEIWSYRELAFFLAWRDVLVRYRQTVIGVLWALVRPFLTIVIFTFVFAKLARVPSGDVPYPVFSLAGLLPWQLFASTLMEVSNSVVGNSQLVSKVYFPRLIIPISAMITSFIDFLIAAAMLAVLMAWYGVPLSSNVVWIIPMLLLCSCAALGAGIWFAALFVKYRDVRHLVPFIVQLGIYISPVGFPSTIVPEKWRFLYSLNPMVAVIDGFRWALFGGTNPIYAPGLAVSVILSILILVTGAYYFRHAERLFADVI